MHLEGRLVIFSDEGHNGDISEAVGFSLLNEFPPTIEQPDKHLGFCGFPELNPFQK